MKYASALVAPTVTMLLLCSAINSALNANEAQDAMAGVNSSLSAVRRDARIASSTLTKVRSGISPAENSSDVPGLDLDAVLSRYLVSINKLAMVRQVSLDRIVSAGLAQQQAYASVGSIARTVNLTGGHIQAVSLKLQGSYSDFNEFQRFLTECSHLSAFLSFKVTGSKFEAVVEIYGGAQRV